MDPTPSANVTGACDWLFSIHMPRRSPAAIGTPRGFPWASRGTYVSIFWGPPGAHESSSSGAIADRATNDVSPVPGSAPSPVSIRKA